MKKNPWIGVILILAIIAVLIAYFAGQHTINSSSTSSNTPTTTTSINQNGFVDRKAFVSDFLSALDQYYISSTEGVGLTNSSTMVDIFSTQIKISDDIAAGNGFLSKYSNSSDPTIKLLANDVTVIMSDYKTKLDASSQAFQNDTQQNQITALQYSVAQMSAAQDEAKTGIIQAGVMMMPIILNISSPNQDPNAKLSGPIDYILSSQDRADLAAQIDTNFGSALSNKSNAYIFAANFIKILLTANTWEEYGKETTILKSQMTATSP